MRRSGDERCAVNRLIAGGRNTAGLLGGQFRSQRFGTGQHIGTDCDRLANEQVGQFGGNGAVDSGRDHDRLGDKGTDQSTTGGQLDRNQTGKG